MAVSQSAGILLFRGDGEGLEVLLVHPGGPFWSRRDAGAWSIPKGEPGPDEEPLAAALREFEEELGSPPPPAGEAIKLGAVRQRAGKLVQAWALRGELDAAATSSNTFELEWPPGSGRMRDFPEVDRAEWFGLPRAREKINPAQTELIDRLVAALAA